MNHIFQHSSDAIQHYRAQMRYLRSDAVSAVTQAIFAQLSNHPAPQLISSREIVELYITTAELLQGRDACPEQLISTDDL